MDIYRSCPQLKNEIFCLRKTELEDARELLRIYEDEKAVPFFNSDNYRGEDLYYTTLEEMQEAIRFWQVAYANRSFVRWSIQDRKTEELVGTFETFYRESDDYYNGCGVIRLDLRSDYETKEYISSLMQLMLPNMYEYFDCRHCVTKAVPQEDARILALEECGFKSSDEPLIGNDDQKAYHDYWIIGV